MRTVTSVSEFLAAIADPARDARVLAIRGSLVLPHSVILPPGFELEGEDSDSCMISFSSGDGLGLTAENEISNLSIQTTPSRRAIYVAAAGQKNLGSMSLSYLTVTGQVQ